MSMFTIPTLSRPEIIQVLSECKIAHVSDADLLHPDPDFICNLYQHILLPLESSEEDDSQLEFGALDQLDIPDHHVNSVQIMNFFTKMQRFLASVECSEAFNPKDLIKPVANRTAIFLSALLNFYLHREEKLSNLKPFDDEIQAAQDRQRAVEDKISQLNAEIAEYELSRERELPAVDEINSQVKELNQTLTDLNNHQVKLKTSLKELKAKAKEMDEKVSNAEFALVQSVQENANLRSKIVHSPDKLQRALEIKKSAQVETKNVERAAAKVYQDKIATLEAYDKACKKMSKHLAQMQAIQEQVNHAKEVDKDVKVVKKKLSDEAVLDKSLEAKLVELQSEAHQLEEAKKQLEKDIGHRNEETSRELKNVKLEVESKKHALELRQKHVESLIAEGDALALKKRTVEEEGEANAKRLYHKCEEILAEFYKYSRSIGDLLPNLEGMKYSIKNEMKETHTSGI